MKRRMTCYMAAWTVLLYGTALGGGLVSEDGWVTSSATSGRMVVDTRAGKGTLTTDHAEGIAYSGLWDGDTDATATVAVDGRTVKTATGEGVYTWTPSAVGTYTLTHRTTKDGVPVGETLTATFTVASRVAPPNAPAVADKVWTFVRSASAAKPSVLVAPDGKWRLRAAGPEDGTVYVSYYPPPPPPPPHTHTHTHHHHHHHHPPKTSRRSGSSRTASRGAARTSRCPSGCGTGGTAASTASRSWTSASRTTRR